MAGQKKLNAIAKQQIKYNKSFIKAGEKFKVNEDDVEELQKYADIEILEQNQNNNENTNKEDEDGEKEGE